ncbi:mediator complex subunit [Coemansia sp. RSA 1939]|nr:mediator complex subunit [Coemansia sp. RSA 1939]KAJ2604268.1 mediator complex subunit [Coemansia sp. RSA 1804]
MQRVPLHSSSTSDSAGRTLVPGTPVQADTSMEPEGNQSRSSFHSQSMRADSGSIENGQHFPMLNNASGGGPGGNNHISNSNSNSNNGGSVNGQTNGSGGDKGGSNGDSVSDSGDIQSEADDIPQVDVQMIPLSVIIGRLVTYAYTELVTLVDTLPSRHEADRRNDILRYTEHVSDLLTKLLVLVRWAKNAPQIQKCQNVIAYLDSQNKFFEFSVDAIMHIFMSMPSVRMRNYDVSNAVDVLTTGTYLRLPLAMKQSVPPPKLSKRQIRDTLRAINDIIRSRILRGEPIPPAMRRYKIAHGRIVFTVAKEFKATLTLLQYENAIPWHIVSVQVLVGGDKSLSSEQQITVNTWQILDRAQSMLIEASTAHEKTLAAESQDSGTSNGAGERMPDAQPPQLAQLYDFLHQQCLTVLLESIFKQSSVLRRTRWENLLQVEMSANRLVLTLKYWTSSRAASAAYSGSAIAHGGAVGGVRFDSIVFRLVPLAVPRPIHASASDGPTALETSPVYTDSPESGDFVRIERDRRNLIPKLGLCVTWSAYSGLVSPGVWSRTVSQASELSEDGSNDEDGSHDFAADSDDFSLVVDPEQVNVERLLRQVTWRHACTILESLHVSMSASKLFSKDAVDLHFVTASGATIKTHELTREEASLGTSIPRLRAWYRETEGAVDITVDTFTGRLVVRASEVVVPSTALSESMVGQLAEQLNRTPWRLAELLVDMRSSLALVDLDCLSFRSLGLRAQSVQSTGFPNLPGFVVHSGMGKYFDLTGSTGSTVMGSWSGVPGVGVSSSSPNMATNFPLRVSQQEADALVREVAGVENPLGRIRFYMIEGTDGVEEHVGTTSQGKGEWYIMVAMTDRLRFRLVLLNPHPTDRLMFVVGQIISLQVDRLFYSVARRLLAEKGLDSSMFTAGARASLQPKSGSGNWSDDNRAAAEVAGSTDGSDVDLLADEREITEKVDAMLTGRTSITLDYLNALASACRARLALRLLQTQLTRWKIPYSFRLPSFSTSPHGHRAAVSKELSVVGLDKMGLYELDEQVPVLYIPVFALMRASPINWNVANLGVLPDEARRMISIRIASDELDPSLRADLSSSTRVDQHRQAALAKVAGKVSSFAERPRATYASLSNSVALNHADSNGDGSSSGVHATRQSLIGRHVVPCQVIASIPIALDNLPDPVARAYSDAVYFGTHAASDGGYHLSETDSRNSGCKTGGSASKRGPFRNKGGYSKVVLVYKQMSRAVQCLIRDWSEHHLMTHIARNMYSWEQPPMRRVIATTTAYYPFNSGPYTGAVANMLGSWRGHQSTEIVIQCISSWFLSISCRVPYPFANEDSDRSMYPPGYADSGGNDLSFHLTLANVDPKTNKILRIASTWPWAATHTSRQDQDVSDLDFAHAEHEGGGGAGYNQSRRAARSVGFEVSTSLSRWLHKLQARLNLTGSPLPVLSMILHLMPVNYIIDAISSQVNIRSLSPSLHFDSRDTLIRYQLRNLLTGNNSVDQGGVNKAEAKIEKHGKESSETTGPASADEGKDDNDDEKSYIFLQKIMSQSKGLENAFKSVKGLYIMHMYTSADNIRLVFNSRYVVDLRLVSSEMFQISDAVGAAQLLSRQTIPVYGRGSAMAPAPLVTAGTEPIPLFAEWMEAVARKMRFEWGALERHVSSILGEDMWQHLADDANEKGGSSSSSSMLDKHERIKFLQRGLFRLRPEATKAERMMFRVRQISQKQSSSKSPVFVPMPPSALMCSKLQLVVVLRSLMEWLVRSVHVQDQLGMAISRTQEIIDESMAAPGSEWKPVDGQQALVARTKEPLFGVKEKLVVNSNGNASSAETKRVMIVGFTGAKESVRCEFLMRATVKGDDTDSVNTSDEESQRVAHSSAPMDVDSGSGELADAVAGDDVGGDEDMSAGIMALSCELFSIPSSIMHVDLDVRIVPMNRPPNGITDAAAAFLVEAFKTQTTSFRQRAGVLVRILALPPQLVMDVVDIAKKLDGKVVVSALQDGSEHNIRLDAGQSKVFFALKLLGRDNKWYRLYIDYALLSGTAQILYALGPKTESMSVDEIQAYKGELQSWIGPWTQLMDGVVARLDAQTAFTRDMGKSGKSRWFDIVDVLYTAFVESPLSAEQQEAESSGK